MFFARPRHGPELRGANDSVSEERLATRCGRLEMPDRAPSDEKVMLSGFTGIGQGQTRSAGPEVADIEANGELMQDSDVQAESTLNHA